MGHLSRDVCMCVGWREERRQATTTTNKNVWIHHTYIVRIQTNIIHHSEREKIWILMIDIYMWCVDWLTDQRHFGSHHSIVRRERERERERGRFWKNWKYWIIVKPTYKVNTLSIHPSSMEVWCNNGNNRLFCKYVVAPHIIISPHHRIHIPLPTTDWLTNEILDLIIRS